GHDFAGAARGEIRRDDVADEIAPALRRHRLDRTHARSFVPCRYVADRTPYANPSQCRVPAQAGTHFSGALAVDKRGPAFAGTRSWDRTRSSNELLRFFLEGAAEEFAGFGDRQGGADLDPVGHLVARC